MPAGSASVVQPGHGRIDPDRGRARRFGGRRRRFFRAWPGPRRYGGPSRPAR